MQRIREGFKVGIDITFPGPTKVDETHLGGKRNDMPRSNRAKLKGRGAVGRTAIVVAKDRSLNKIVAMPVPETKGGTLQNFVRDHTEPNSKVYTDEASRTRDCPRLTVY